MAALEEFDTTLTLCFTPEHLGVAPHYTSPPKRTEDFAEFTRWAVGRYCSRRVLARHLPKNGDSTGEEGGIDSRVHTPAMQVGARD
jgi:hypothetical protein